MNKFRPILILSLFILFMVSLGAISAEELNSTVVNDAPATDSIYVDSNATIGGNGALNNPMNNIKDAVNSVDNNSVIHVKGGNYSTSDNSKIIINKTITIESYDGTAVINGKYSDYVFYITDKGSLTLKNIEFVNTDFPEPVVPAISICGIFAISATTTFPAMSFPAGKASFDL